MADLRMAAFEKQLLNHAQQLQQLKEQLELVHKTFAEFQQVLQGIQAQVEAHDEDINEIVTGLESLTEDDDDDENSTDEDSDDDEDESPLVIPGFEVTAKGDLVIDEQYLESWTPEQKVQVGKYLPTPLNLESYLGQPRELTRLLFEALAQYDVSPPAPVVPTVTMRATVPVEQASMPEILPMGGDGLPERSPIVGKAMFFHVPRALWRTDSPFMQLHQIAERLRSELTRVKSWTCKGFNCHDCVEQSKNVNRVIQCAVAQVRRGNEPFTFELKDDERSFYTENVESLVVELDAANQKKVKV